MHLAISPSWITYCILIAAIIVPCAIPAFLTRSIDEAMLRHVIIGSLLVCTAVLCGILWPMASGKAIVGSSDIEIRAFYKKHKIPFAEIVSVDFITADLLTKGVRTNGIAIGKYRAGNFKINHRPAVMLVNDDSLVKIETSARDYYLSADGEPEKLLKHIVSAMNKAVPGHHSSDPQ